VVERFVGRDKEMARIAKVLLPSLTSQMRRKVFIIHGLGGVGKTQLSVEYARNYHENYSAVLWIDGSTKERVRRSIADLASQLPQHQLSEKSREYLQNKSSDVDEIVEGVLNWLSRPSNDQWLLVFDNVDREYTVPSKAPEAFDVKDYFPTAEQGSILITSRLASLWELGAEDMKLRPVDELQGKSILENSTGRAEEGKCYQRLVRYLCLTLGSFRFFRASCSTPRSPFGTQLGWIIHAENRHHCDRVHRIVRTRME